MLLKEFLKILYKDIQNLITHQWLIEFQQTLPRVSAQHICRHCREYSQHVPGVTAETAESTLSMCQV